VFYLWLPSVVIMVFRIYQHGLNTSERFLQLLPRAFNVFADMSNCPPHLSVMRWISGHVGSMILCLVSSSDDRGFSISRWHHHFRVTPSPSYQGLLCLTLVTRAFYVVAAGISWYLTRPFCNADRAVFLSHFSRGVSPSTWPQYFRI
jgi:hypothetical protein